jgi:hypothetical protein
MACRRSKKVGQPIIPSPQGRQDGPIRPYPGWKTK